MEISTDVLLEALSPLARWKRTAERDDDAYAFPLPFSAAERVRGHVLLLSPEDAAAPLRRDCGALAVFSAPPPETAPAPACPALLPDRPVPEAEIQRRLVAVYDRLGRWAKAIAGCGADIAGVKQMLELSASEMKGDFALIDVSYYVPAFTDTGASNIRVSVDPEHGRATEQAISVLSDDPRLTWVREARGVQLYESDMKSAGAPKTLYRNMFRNGEKSFYNRLLFFRQSEQFSATDRFMMEYLAQQVERITVHLKTYSVPASKYFALKQQLLRVPEPDYRQSGDDLDVLSSLGWREDDRYRFYIFSTFYPNRDDGITDFILRMLEQLLPGSYGAMDGERILLLQNVTRADTDPYVLRRRLADFLRENLYKAGISNEFRSFSLLRGAYCQADAALKLGEKRDPMLWYFPFEKYLRDYLLWKVSTDIPGEMLVLPALERLLRTDREKGTDYTETLRVLSEANYNTTHAAQQLYIHRTTLQSRLERIQQISELDLTDSDVRFLLQFSFRLLND